MLHAQYLSRVTTIRANGATALHEFVCSFMNGEWLRFMLLSFHHEPAYIENGLSGLPFLP
jgi:hypothetical protein